MENFQWNHWTSRKTSRALHGQCIAKLLLKNPLLQRLSSLWANPSSSFLKFPWNSLKSTPWSLVPHYFKSILTSKSSLLSLRPFSVFSAGLTPLNSSWAGGWGETQQKTPKIFPRGCVEKEEAVSVSWFPLSLHMRDLAKGSPGGLGEQLTLVLTPLGLSLLHSLCQQ